MMKQILAAVAAVMLMSGSALAAANNLELNFNDESAQARLGVIINQDAYGTSMFEVRGLYNDEDELDAWMTSGGFAFIGEPGNAPGLELGVLADVKVGDLDVPDSEFGGVGVGGVVRYYPPALGGFGVGGRFLYTPEIFAFLEADGMTEFSTRAGYIITPKIGVHVEFQKVEIEFDRGFDYDLDEEVRVGFEARF